MYAVPTSSYIGIMFSWLESREREDGSEEDEEEKP